MKSANDMIYVFILFIDFYPLSWLQSYLLVIYTLVSLFFSSFSRYSSTSTWYFFMSNLKFSEIFYFSSLRVLAAYWLFISYFSCFSLSKRSCLYFSSIDSRFLSAYSNRFSTSTYFYFLTELVWDCILRLKKESVVFFIFCVSFLFACYKKRLAFCMAYEFWMCWFSAYFMLFFLSWL